MSKSITPNNREILYTQSTVTGRPEYVSSTDHALNINATISSTGIATSANQTNGDQKTQIVDAGGEAATVTGGKLDVNATASLAGTALPISGATEAVGVAIVDGSGDQITSFGGGTQYTEGASTPATPTGTLPVFDNAGTIAAVSDTTPLPVLVPGVATEATLVSISTAVSGTLNTNTSQINGSTTEANNGPAGQGTLRVTIADDSSGIITANAGTNLNTSALALESGGNLATIAGKDFATQTTLAAINAKLVSGTDIGDVTINNASGAAAVNIQDGGNSITIDGSVAITSTDTAPATQNITVVDSGSTATVSANGQSLITGTATANSTASFSLSGQETIRVQVTGTWTGTLTSEASIDGGTTWAGLGIHQGAYTTGSFTANFIGGANVAGATTYRIRATAAMTGTATVRVVESVNTASTYIANAAPAGNVISLLNSTTATLTSGSIFTGIGEDVSNFSEMRISVKASHASATDGLSMQQSPDNTNWDITDNYTVSATTGKTFVVPRQARYFRVVYTNGGTNQSSFRLQSILNRTATSSSSQRAQDTFSNENDLEQVWAFNSYYNGTTWDMARGTVAAGAYADLRGIGGVAPSVSSGNKDTGTLRVTNATDDINLSAIKTAVEIIDNIVSGSGANISQLGGTSTATGNGGVTAGALRVTLANDSTGVVDKIVTSVVPGTSATHLGKAEDAAHTTGDTGVFALGVRNDTLADVTTTTADYSQVSTDLKGRVMTAGAPRSLKGNVQVALSNTTSETTIIAATASTFHDVYGIILANTGATTTKVSIRDDTGGTVRAIIEVPTLETRGFMLPVDSAMTQTATNKNWTAQCASATTALEVTAFYVSMV